MHASRWGRWLLAGMLLGAAACTGGSPQTVRGVVVAVEARSLARAEAFTLRADDGRELTFRLGPEVDRAWTPGHLREHAALGEPVVVTFTREGDALVAVRLADAVGSAH
ncbi:MAG TPA: hypothetical protein VKZ60_01465 [Chloroflexota bacterium]|nr:hypothetical protein [Chloroflexota bacterium]